MIGFKNNVDIDETSIALWNHIYAIKGVVRLRGQRSNVVKMIFIQTHHKKDFKTAWHKC